MQVDIRRFPFSRRGAYLSITLAAEGNRLLFRNCRRLFGEERFMEAAFLDSQGRELPFAFTATPSCLDIAVEGGRARLAVGRLQEIHGHAEGLRVRLVPRGGWSWQAAGNDWRNHVITNHNHVTDAVVHRGAIDGRTTVELVGGYHKQTGAEYLLSPDADGRLSFSVICSPREVLPDVREADFDRSVEEARQDFADWAATLPPVPDRYAEAARLLWYNLWSSIVSAGGNFRYDAMLMSKASMCAVWSWDHCFNALALMLSGRTREALEQFFLLFEMQSPEGKLPDFINTEIDWRAAVKPPVHGWCFGLLMDRSDLPAPVLEKAYGHLAAWTDWHFTYRDTDGDGIPEYIMGNDSGWDNATLFDAGTNMETPDLPAYLFLQMRTLGRIARALGREGDATAWRDRSEALLRTFLDHSWHGGVFVARKSGSHAYDPHPESLLSCMPIVAGDSLPADLVDALVRRIETGFVTPHGVATESPASRRYLSDGYWRGPVWAPSTLLVVDGLVRSGRPELARRIALAFCDTVAASGAYENFDALTGRGLCDMGYTWTSSAALYLMAVHAGLPGKNGPPEGTGP